MRPVASDFPWSFLHWVPDTVACNIFIFYFIFRKIEPFKVNPERPQVIVINLNVSK